MKVDELDERLTEWEEEDKIDTYTDITVMIDGEILHINDVIFMDDRIVLISEGFSD